MDVLQWGIWELGGCVALIVVPVGAMGPFWPGDSPLRAAVVGTCELSKVESLAPAPCLPRFILLGRFSHTLLVVLFLDSL